MADLGGGVRPGPVALVSGALLLGAAGGIAPGALPPAATTAVAGAALALLLVVLSRRALGLNARRDTDSHTGARDGAVAGGGEALRLPRLLFYAGTATLGVATLEPVAGLTLSQLLFMASSVGCLLAVLRGSPIVTIPRWLVIGALLFALGGAMSTPNAESPKDSLIEVGHALYVVLLWSWTAAMTLRTRAHVYVATALWALALALTGIAALMQLADVNALVADAPGSRMSGLMPHPNDLGGAAAVALVPALLLASYPSPHRGRLTRILRCVPAGLIATALVLSGSVAGLVAGVAGLIAWLSSPAVRSSARIAIVTAIVASLGIVAAADDRAISPAQRVEQVTNPATGAPDTGSGEERLSIVRTAWPTIAANPLIGQGLDPAGTVVNVISAGGTRVHQVHGLPIAAWYSAGIFGLAGVLVIIVAFGAAGLKGVARSSSMEDHLVGWTLCAAFVAFVVQALATPMAFQQYGWFAGVMAVAWGLRRERAAVGADASATVAPSPAADQRFRGARAASLRGTSGGGGAPARTAMPQP